jgi:serine/threonine-protein kinase
MSNDTPSPADEAPTLRAGTGELPVIRVEDLVKLQRYELGQLIGRGGMGEVRQCRDTRLSRQIALKTATTKSPAELSRFVREAQVQGQLEHPGIVPVYELGIGDDGTPYLAMKRVLGETLLEVLSQLKRGDAPTREKYPRRRLLQAFLAVCQAVDYAHTKGWIHRDLKPANVMLGDFGEAYVLDWGLARQAQEPTEGPTEDIVTPQPAGLTVAGTLMGTPGYMAPEQVLARPVTVRSDVYALGAILFEVLTHQLLASGETAIELLNDTNRGCDARARTRAPHMDVPPELEAVCVRATQKNPAQRFSSVRELHDAVDRVLAGERDLELRAVMAAQHASAARSSISRASSETNGELDHRKAALRELGLALALDPDHRPALEALIELMATPPRTIPPEAEAEVFAAEVNQARTGTRAAAFAFAGVTTAGIVNSWSRMHHLWPLGVLALFGYGVAAVSAWGSWWRKKPQGIGAPWLILTTLALLSVYFLDGPLTIVPALTTATMVGFAAVSGKRYQRLCVGLALFTAVGPLLGSVFGLLPESFRYVNEGLLLLPLERSFHPVWSTLNLLVCFAAASVGPTFLVTRLSASIGELNRRRALQAWNLKQMLPPLSA